MNYDTTNHILWPFEDEIDDVWNEFDEADLMFAEYKLSKENQQ